MEASLGVDDDIDRKPYTNSPMSKSVTDGDKLFLDENPTETVDSGTALYGFTSSIIVPIAFFYDGCLE